MEDLIDLANQKIYHDNTTDIYLIAARRYSFWMIYETYDEYKHVKKEMQQEKEKADMVIKEFPEDKQTKIREIIELYKWKEDNYGREK